MKRLGIVFFIVLQILIPRESFAEQVNQDNAAELSVREGLPNFYGKIANGDNLKIGYFGGSITEQKGWRVHSLEYFRKRFPKATFEEINAAIGGTNSQLGAFRANRDLISKEPDLVFVEFSCNDNGLDFESCKNSTEGIVRNIRKNLPKTDICFVYVITDGTCLKTIQDGKNTASMKAHEAVAQNYGITSINMGIEIANLAKEEKLVMKTEEKPMERVEGSQLDDKSGISKLSDGRIPFSKDGVHPFPNTGHILYMKALERSFEKLENIKGDKNYLPLPKPVSKNPIENPSMTRSDDVRIRYSGDFNDATEELKYFKHRGDSIMHLKPNSSMEFAFDGTMVCIYDVIGTFSGTIKAFVDGKECGIFRRFDPYCTWNRAAFIILAKDLPLGKHIVKIEVLNNPIDKASVVFEHTKPIFEKNPKIFEPIDFFPMWILTDGNIVDL